MRVDHRDHDCVWFELLKCLSVFNPGSSSELACSSKDERPGHPAHEEDGASEVVPHKVKESPVNLVMLIVKVTTVILIVGIVVWPIEVNVF